MNRFTKTIAVSGIMLNYSESPVVCGSALYMEALEEMARKKIGLACIIDENRRLLGVISDGDLRRQLLTIHKPLSALFVDDALLHSTKDPVSIKINETIGDAVLKMTDSKVWDLPVLDEGGGFVGLLHFRNAVNFIMNNDDS